tara:strand:+ start:553 stop:804 length:252 start_codon:yes stop_codon:yes gene_type:complete
MEYEQLKRCYKNVLSQRDRYHDSGVELELLVDRLMSELNMAIDEINTMRDIHHTDNLTPADHWDKESLHDAQLTLARARGEIT